VSVQLKNTEYLLSLVLFLLISLNRNNSLRSIAARHGQASVISCLPPGAAVGASFSPGADVRIIQRWSLPPVLKEISGIDHIAGDRFACIMDEKGIIFIYNTAENRIERMIPFTGNGDFEGIAIAGTTAYALRADGTIFEIKRYSSNKPSVKEYHTPFSRKQDVEGLCYDATHQRLLLAIKKNEPGGDHYKGIYAFDLGKKTLSPTPVYRIEFDNKIWSQRNGSNTMRPSDLAIHPRTGDIYITDGEDPKLLILGTDGTHKYLYRFDHHDFPLPEGICFAGGGLFIANEGVHGDGSILKIALGEEAGNKH
jgi:uncharacterized protein YjiK